MPVALEQQKGMCGDFNGVIHDDNRVFLETLTARPLGGSMPFGVCGRNGGSCPGPRTRPFTSLAACKRIHIPGLGLASCRLVSRDAHWMMSNDLAQLTVA